MKLLLDEHFPSSIAEQLRGRGHDVIAVRDEVELRGSSDPDLLAEACRRERALSTENAVDYLPLDAEYRSGGREHWGIVLTTNQAFPRGAPATVGALVKALDVFLREYPDSRPTSLLWWLQRKK